MSWWTTPWRAGAVMLALLACNANAFGDERTPAKAAAGSLSDGKGCKFVDPHPLPEETVTWTGACVDGWAEGEGTAQWFTKGQAGQRYVGTMARGLYEGHGVLHRADGSVIEGEFVAGMPPIGRSVMQSASGVASGVDMFLGRVRAFEVCTKIARPEMPAVAKWTGDAVYQAYFTVRAGHVVSVDIKVLRSTSVKDIDRSLINAVVAALQQYECPGDHAVAQQFMFRNQ